MAQSSAPVSPHRDPTRSHASPDRRRMAKGWIPEFKPFLVLFGLEALAIGKLAFAK